MRALRFATPLVLGSLLGLGTAMVPLTYARAQIGIVISVNVPPPVLPVYEQPPVPAYGYIWAPGYWAWSAEDADYYWVPGTWVLPPEPGLLWTPGYWGWNDGEYGWNPGYWAPNVGFYGGVNYGYGYGGDGYEGGYWQHGAFFYNRRANNFGNVHITNVYERNVTNITVNRISYNGGQGGIQRRPSPQDMQYRQEHHYGPTEGQMQQEHMAAGNRDMFAHQNHGVPPIAATGRPAQFSGHDVEAAHNAPVDLPPEHAEGQRTPEHPGGMMAPQRQAEPVHPDSMMAPAHNQDMMKPAHPEPTPRPMQEQHMTAPQGQMEMNRPEAPAYHAPEQTYHPPAPAYRPAPAQAERPAQQFHPAGGMESRPESRPENHPESRPAPGHEDHKPN